MTAKLKQHDPEIASAIANDLKRQQRNLLMIPSENYASEDVMEATGSVLANKYSEGYPGKRYYQGNEFADVVENAAIERAKRLFGAEHANVQPYSGSPANAAVFLAFLRPGDTFMGFELKCGGHLTHGSPVNFSGLIYSVVPYGVDEKTERLDMEEVRRLARERKPKLIISGSTAYPRQIDFKAFQEIAEEVGAIHLADMSHVSGLVAGGAHPSPFPFTDVVMTTTHKTLRGPRGAMILCKEKYAKQIDKAVFPGSQGGPHDHTTAGIAVALKEALEPGFRDYAHQVVANAKALAHALTEHGIRLVTGGTDNHLILIDLRPMGIGLGKQAAVALEAAGVITNCNTVPYDPSTPFKPSGVRIGTPSLTTRGMKEPEMRMIGEWMASVLKGMGDAQLQAQVRAKVEALCERFPIYEGLGK